MVSTPFTHKDGASAKMAPEQLHPFLLDMMHVTNHFVITECAMALCILVHAFRSGNKFRKNTDYIISKELGTFFRSKDKLENTS